MKEYQLFDVPSAATRRKLLVLNVLGTAAIIGVMAIIAQRFAAAGQFRAELWLPFLEPGLWRTIGYGLGATIRAAVWCIVLSIVLGAILGIARLSPRIWIRLPVGAWVEFFRAIPSLLVILLLFLAYSKPFGTLGSYIDAHAWGWLSVLIGAEQLKTLGPLVVAVVIQHSAIIAEVFRAGILAVPKGQHDAAYALGLRRGGVLRFVLLPQAVRGMLPALVSECVRSLKATALGYAIGYLDLLRTGQIIAAALHNVIPVALVIGAIYVALCLPLAWLAEWLERRTRVQPNDHPDAPEPAGRPERQAAGTKTQSVVTEVS